MRIAILETGRPPADLAGRFGTYPAMFADLLGRDFEAVSFDVAAGELPERPEDFPAYLVTGSPAGVYEEHPWIAPLKDFLRAAKGKARIVGICFGHQIMAEAFGGIVEKSERGWGVGLQTLEIKTQRPFMNGEARVSVPASHQDQIVVPPPAVEVLAGSAFSPYGVLAYTDHPALSMQFHPEFAPAFAQALVESRRDRLPDPDAAIASLAGPNDSACVAGWIRSFLRDEPE
ncbi:type 1 glutamine amidotransferase [Sphingosinicella sp. BN140058]|uniref:type 1 glutamine amidotransferase n=1 Tax=Sphingosinicella sp. BN140058 TaxID=1892855 RepID=UPI0010115554|nr:type 1 glutamine amidotransferase [Sphingosinicella sp. BN140058]QAY76228.1 type 1 glutamine amidotransferase [Sphingosinicella sp. BN140058]